MILNSKIMSLDNSNNFVLSSYSLLPCPVFDLNDNDTNSHATNVATDEYALILGFSTLSGNNQQFFLNTL